MNLSTNVKTHVIVTFGKTKHFITTNQNDNLVNLGNNDLFEIDGNKIRVNQIAEILKIDDFYKFYPKDKPESTNYTYPDGLPKRDKMEYGKKHLDTKERLEQALKIWKDQRDNNKVVIQTGGLQRLINWGEQKLSKI